MVLEDDRTGAGIPHISGTFNAKLVARLNRAPGDIMGFLEACAMGNQARVEELLEKGVVSRQACSSHCNLDSQDQSQKKRKLSG